MLGLQKVSAVANSPPLPVGSWWTTKGSYRQAGSGTGSDEGTYTQTGDFTIKFLVTKKDSDTITLSRQVDGHWSCTATGQAWQCSSSSKSPSSGTYSNTYQYTIALSTLTVMDVGENASKNFIGHPTMYMVNVGQLTEGGKAPGYWWVPNSDAKDNHVSDVDFGVSTETANMKGVQLKVWSLSYSDDVLGDWKNGDGVYSRGPGTETNLYDPVYGIWVGWSYKETTNGTEVGNAGTWTEQYSEDSQLVDTSLSFTVPVTLDIEPGAGVAVTVDGTTYADQFPRRFDWGIGSTHTLQVDPSTQGPSGIQYVFVQWSDGSKDTSRTFTATQESSLTATFKIQYQLLVSSDLGNPQGSGWYDVNTQATFSVTTPLTVEGFLGTLGGKYVFDHWSGDVTAATATTSVTMDGPKTAKAEWRTDYTMPYIIIGAIVAAIAIIVALLLMRRRRVPTPASTYQPPSPAPAVPQPPPPVTSTLPPPAPPGVQPPAGKFCVNCGAPLKVRATYCNECGTKQ